LLAPFSKINEVDLTLCKVYAPDMEEAQAASGKNESQTPDQAIVAFIDILGYEGLVNRHINDLEMIKAIEGLLQGPSDLIQKLRAELTMPPPYDEYGKKLHHAITVKFVSDTILITLHPSKVETSSPLFEEREHLSHSVLSYLHFIATVCANFIGITGLLVRGGISMGPHYENPHDGSLFIFSQAYINAYKLEGKADTPRILIDDKVLEFITGLHAEELKRFVFLDSSGEKCLDIYAIFENEPRSPAILSEIKERVSRNMFKIRQDKKALRKFIHFFEYHNQRVLRLGFPDMILDLAGPKKYFDAL
jgi:hypothetical protein